MMEKYYLTPEGEQELREELARLKGPEREEIARRLKAAIEMGDLSENAEYIATKEEQGFLEGRIQEIEHILRNAEIIENNGKRDRVELGVTVTIQEEGYPEEVYYLVGRQEADPTRGRISNESPIGRALMGKQVGDVVDVETPAGVVKLKILKIE